jgi:lanthanide-dependent methanol dehydrogenase
MGKASLAILTLAALAACSTTSSSPPRRADHQRDTELTLARTGGTTASGGRGAAALEAALAPDSSQAQWTIPAKNYASTRYSGLDQINVANVAGLQLAFTFSTGVTRGHEAAPLVVGRTMYIVTPFPNTLYALDLSRDGAPRKWKFTPAPARAAQGVACCGRGEPARASPWLRWW